jgi:hypothetical protein
MDLFGWRSPKDSAAHKAPIFGPQAILQDLDNRVPKYLDDADQGKPIYPTCKRNTLGRGRRCPVDLGP